MIYPYFLVQFIPTELWQFCYTNTPYFRLLAFKVIYTLSTFLNSSSITTNCMYSTTSQSNITANVNTLFTFFKLAYYV